MVNKIISCTEGYSRIINIKIDGKKFKSPIFFPSISSFGLKIPIWKLSDIINNYSFSRVLISCYDLYYSQSHFSFLNEYSKENIIFLDSGCYESSRYNNPDWDITKYLECVKKFPFDIYTSYDYLPKSKHENFKTTYDNNIKNIMTSKINNKSLFTPIFHSLHIEDLFKMINLFLKEYSNEFMQIGITERELGHDLLSIIKNIKNIREILNHHNDKVSLHLFGSGDPLSIILYTYVGVDSFDSRDWAKRLFNRNNLMRYPISFLNLIECDCPICQINNIEYIDKVLLHNLIFYENFFNEIHEHIENNGFRSFLSNYINEDFVNKIDKI